MSLNPKYVENDNETVTFVLEGRLRLSKFYLKHSNGVLNKNQIKDVLDQIIETTDVVFTEDEIVSLVNLYPKVKAYVIEYGVDDTETRSFISGMVSDFFLGTDWPTYGDNVNIDIFVKRLKDQAVKARYKVRNL